MLAVADAAEAVLWRGRRTVNPDQRGDGRPLRSLLDRHRRHHALLLDVLGRYFDIRRQVYQDLQNGPAQDRDLLVVLGDGSVCDLEFLCIQREPQRLTDETDVLL